MNAIVSFALRQRVLIVVMLIMLLGAGLASFLSLNIEAYPDPVPPLVDIVTQSTGQSAEEIERYITIPLEVQMAGIPHVQAIRTISLFGLSDVKVQFTYDLKYQQAEQWVINRLSQLAPLPNGAQKPASSARLPLCCRALLPWRASWAAENSGRSLQPPSPRRRGGRAC